MGEGPRDERATTGAVAGRSAPAPRAGWRRTFQFGAAVVAVLVLVQAVVAGQVLIGRELTPLHEANSHVIFALSLLLLVVGIVGWRRGQLPTWLGVVGGPALFVFVTLQAFAGYARVFTLHVPLGTALFGLALVLVTGSSRAEPR